MLNSAVCTAQKNVFVTSIVKPSDGPALCVVIQCFPFKMVLKLETSMGKILMEKGVCHDGIQFLLGMLW